MNIPTSEVSSGCESSWTMYLNQLSNSTGNQIKGTSSSVHAEYNKDQEDEDLSMISDASSGPPHLAVPSLSEDGNKGRKESSQTKEKQHVVLCLDDTASSPALRLSQDNAAPSENQISQVFSTTHFEGEPLPNKQLST